MPINRGFGALSMKDNLTVDFRSLPCPSGKLLCEDFMIENIMSILRGNKSNQILRLMYI